MTFMQYIKRRQKRGDTLAYIATEADVSLPTIYRAMAGLQLSYGTAKKLADASDGELDVIELCEGSR